MLSFALIGLMLHFGQQLEPLLTGRILLAEFTKWYQVGIFLAIPLLLCYDGTRGKKSRAFSRFFYWFYPAHLLVLYLLDRFAF